MEPIWGPQTSYLNFCEEDYVVTRYVAEFVNTLSSLAFVAYGVYGLSRGTHSRAGPSLISYCGLMGVGVCSAGYHMTLKYHTQMSDELSMHLLTTPLIYRLLTFRASPRRKRTVGLTLAALFTTVMVVHMAMDEFLLHATAFGAAVYIIATRILAMIPRQAPDPRAQKVLRCVARFGCYCFALGYAVWLVDGWACRFLTDGRRAVGLPVAFLLELHGWWHLLTAVGGYVAVALVDLLVSGDIRKDPIETLAWPVPFAARFMADVKE
ncbi:hypothetical protein S7711_02723 [Stachybotrys chartarum IBT 7711]|uniref:Alkaline phytoceramidase n=1 Tax=Stachybotrys chartarum (strain CBS 109288 / IBT 7711) TaxID=1280523 RepID=A0A084AZ41_STACB|nr:hypothetical protein S7711_02723 [Stachybotrys chartarum IBT 7711]KFA45982.1 hypothetical protein S40293_09199 [Stachybotrys chartarum IBT 40293]